jgi:hypothetical protein
MLDVHPVRHAATTWREFFVHIATIVIGLLIAIGLEQTVQHFHHRHLRSGLRESLHSESLQILGDAKGSEIAANYQMDWLTAWMEQVKATLWQHKSLQVQPPYSLPNFEYPTDPLWRAARTSGLAEQLTQPEVNAYSEIELLSGKVDSFYTSWQTAESNRIQFTKQFPHNPDGSVDLSRASREDMRTYLALLSAEFDSVRIFQIWNRYMLSAQETILSGNFQLQDIFNAERKGASPNGYNPTARER